MYSQLRTIRKEVIAFALDMEAKLVENDHKSPWSGMTHPQLLARLEQEVAELRKAIEENAPVTKIEREAADVANFAMFISDNARTQENLSDIDS